MNQRNKKAEAIAAHDAAIIATADHFEVSLYLGAQGGWVRAEARTLPEARTAADDFIKGTQTSRRPLIYAVRADGRAAIVPSTYQP